ncbi:MAG: peptide-methionine (S)-S-oxide reductase MsrA [Lentilitoribacter sp.]
MLFQDLFSKKTEMPTLETALKGRDDAIATSILHFVNGNSLKGPWPSDAEGPEGLEIAYFGMGCFWGVERLYWNIEGVYVTASGYAGGITPNPTYEETVTGKTGHTEIVMVVYDPLKVTYEALLKTFWEEHDPTQGMRQGNDVGTTYRSAIYTTSPEQLDIANSSRAAYQNNLKNAGVSHEITTEIMVLDVFYYAEDYHQQYLAKNPGGYCGLKGTGVTCAG